MLPRRISTILIFLAPSFLIGASFLFGSWKYAILCLFFFAYSALAFFKMEWAIIPFIVFSPIMRLPFMGYILEQIKYGMIAFIFIIWLAKKMIYKNARYENLPASIHVFFMTLLGLLTIATLHSINIETSLKTSLIYLSSIMSFYVFCDVLRKEGVMNTVIIILFLLGIFISIAAILQYCIIQFNLFTGLSNYVLPDVERNLARVKMESESFLRIYRSVGTFHHANSLGRFLALLIPLGICLFFSSVENWKKIFFGSSLSLLLTALFCSNSRGAMFSVACSTIFAAIFYYKKMLKWLMLLGLISLLVYIKFDDEINAYFRFSAGISYRNLIWFYITEMIRLHPLLGWGIGTIPSEFVSRFGFVSLGDLDIVLRQTAAEGGFIILEGYTAHNALLNFTVELGILGPFLILWFYLIFFKKAAKLYKIIGDNPLKGILIGLTAAVAGNLSNGVFESYLVFNDAATNTILISIFAGVFALEGLLKREKDRIT